MTHDPDAVDAGQTVTFIYTNYKGEVARRRVVPQTIYFGATEFHPENQWLLDALDLDKGAVRTFAVKDIERWEPEVSI